MCSATRGLTFQNNSQSLGLQGFQLQAVCTSQPSQTRTSEMSTVAANMFPSRAACVPAVRVTRCVLERVGGLFADPSFRAAHATCTRRIPAQINGRNVVAHYAATPDVHMEATRDAPCEPAPESSFHKRTNTTLAASRVQQACRTAALSASRVKRTCKTAMLDACAVKGACRASFSSRSELHVVLFT